ncbi:MAG TPA: lipase maturation factor family protein [Kofleriaceae bacterium]|nr:lipase maturation factor family protein [Kofleriaceae bacterium]
MDDADVRAAPFGGVLERMRARFDPPRTYVITRWLILRLLGVVYLFAFLGILWQGLPLLGEHGLTPAAAHVAQLHDAGMTFWDVPSLFMLDASDGALRGWAMVGAALSLALLVGYANLPSLAVLWLLYGSYERVGQLWWGFGWEIQLLETTVIAACLVHPWDPRPLRAPAPPATAIVLMRWLAFRIMLGAGLIKLRGDPCWTQLTCLDAHFETQPIPNPLSPVFHHLPHAVHAAGVVVNHVVEIVLPWFAFGPRRLRLLAAFGMAAFQILLIVSGNLAFLNWLTLVPVLALLDDDLLIRISPRRARDWLAARASRSRAAGTGHRVFVACIAALVAIKSVPVIENLASHHQAMNRSYDRLALVNTYGAFGSVGDERHELIIEGTLDDDPATARWSAYELPCKPGDPSRRPCVVAPFQWRLDWQIWFAAMYDQPRDPWVLHVVWKLLDGDRAIRDLLATDPFDGAAPRYVRIRRFLYHLQPFGTDTWWTRDHEQLWLPPIARGSTDLRDVLAPYDMPSPSLR